MRFMVMHKVDAEMEAGVAPSQAIIQGMGGLVGEGLKSGVFLDGAGLHRSASRVRIRSAGGACKVIKGPLKGENELVAGFAMVKAKSMDDATELARRIADVAGDIEIEIGPVVEPWDIGLAPKPTHGEGGRFLFLYKAGEKFEAGVPPNADVRAAVGKLNDELIRAGVLLKVEALTPTSKAVRLPAGPKGKRTWIDGPFAESKELIAGFSILNLTTMKEAIAWATRYAEILDGNEVDVRVVGEE